MKKGALEGKLTLKYLDQTGLSLMLAVGATWFKRGSGQQFELSTRWGSSGRINLIGTYSLHACEEQLEGSGNGDQVILNTLASGGNPDQQTVVVLDIAPL